MLEKVINIYKPQGWTPLRTIVEFKKLNKKYKDATISYAGRLDPMAEGVLLLLVGEENKKRKKYQDLTKVYEAEIVFGVATDTYDALGIIEKISVGAYPSEDKIKEYFTNIVGMTVQKYPPYSSKTVNGKPLYWWARNKKISEIEIPAREIEIYHIELLDFTQINISELYHGVLTRIEKIEGDFRQEEILATWRKLDNNYSHEELVKITVRIGCSSGTYIRGIASEIGAYFSCGAFALSIRRTAAGTFIHEKSMHLE